MTRLFFDMEQVAGLARHAREAPARRMTMAQRAAIFGEDRCAVPQPGEERLAPPCLWLVKDEGIYLMSPGLDPDPDPDDPRRRPPVAYADGFATRTATTAWRSGTAPATPSAATTSPRTSRSSG